MLSLLRTYEYSNIIFGISISVPNRLNCILAERHGKPYDYDKAIPDKPKNKMRERDAFTVNIGREYENFLERFT